MLSADVLSCSRNLQREINAFFAFCNSFTDHSGELEQTAKKTTLTKIPGTR
jgi:hypothetical protein